MGKSKTRSSSIKSIFNSGYFSYNFGRRGASQRVPNPVVVVTLNSPKTSSSLSLIRADAASSLLFILFVASNNSSPCSVRISPRACLWKRVVLRLSSRERTCRLTADCDKRRVSPAWVKLPASATA